MLILGNRDLSCITAAKSKFVHLIPVIFLMENKRANISCVNAPRIGVVIDDDGTTTGDANHFFGEFLVNINVQYDTFARSTAYVKTICSLFQQAFHQFSQSGTFNFRSDVTGITNAGITPVNFMLNISFLCITYSKIGVFSSIKNSSVADATRCCVSEDYSKNHAII